MQKNVPPEVITGTNGKRCAYAYVKAGTGVVKVIRSYAGVKSGDQGIGVGGSFYDGKRVYVSAKLAAALDAHEAGHISASEKIYTHTIKPAEDAAAKYTDPARLTANNGETEAQLKDKLIKLIDWDKSIQAFKDKDAAVNRGTGTFHGWETTHGGGPTGYKGPGDIGGIHYDEILLDRSETNPTYKDPNYGDYDPYGP